MCKRRTVHRSFKNAVRIYANFVGRKYVRRTVRLWTADSPQRERLLGPTNSVMAMRRLPNQSVILGKGERLWNDWLIRSCPWKPSPKQSVMHVEVKGLTGGRSANRPRTVRPCAVLWDQAAWVLSAPPYLSPPPNPTTTHPNPLFRVWGCDLLLDHGFIKLVGRTSC